MVGIGRVGRGRLWERTRSGSGDKVVKGGGVDF